MKVDPLAVSALVVSVLGVVGTAIYNALTRSMLLETRQMRRAATEPDVIAYLEQVPSAPELFNIAVQNVGQGVAYAVKVHVVEDWDISPGWKLSTFGLATRGVHLLAPGQTVRAYVGNGIEIFDDKRQGERKHFTVRIEFSAAHSTAPVNQEVKLDFRAFEGMLIAGEPPEVRAANAMKLLAETFTKVASFPYLRVDIRTSRDREREEQALMKRIAARESAKRAASSPESPSPESPDADVGSSAGADTPLATEP